MGTVCTFAQFFHKPKVKLRKVLIKKKKKTVIKVNHNFSFCFALVLGVRKCNDLLS